MKSKKLYAVHVMPLAEGGWAVTLEYTDGSLHDITNEEFNRLTIFTMNEKTTNITSE
jgi:hypothetical protein